MAMKKEGLGEQEARDRIFLCDSQGLVTTTREDKRGKDPHKEKYAKNTKNSADLAEIVDIVKPTAIIGNTEEREMKVKSISNFLPFFTNRCRCDCTGFQRKGAEEDG